MTAEKGGWEWQKEGSENFFEKSFQKIWRLQKNALPLHHFRADKTAGSKNRESGASRKEIATNQIEKRSLRFLSS